MSVNIVTDQRFDIDVLKSEKPVLVDFWAEWCGPCKMMAPVLESISDKYEASLSVYKLDADVNTDATAKFQITGLPTCILFINGKEVSRIVGFRSEDAVVDELKKHIEF